MSQALLQERPQPSDTQALCDAVSCQRGVAENRIEERQLDLSGGRASCHRFAANQFRYVLVRALRREALAGTELAASQVETAGSAASGGPVHAQPARRASSGNAAT